MACKLMTPKRALTATKQQQATPTTRYHYSGWKSLQTLWESKCVQNIDPEMSKMLLAWLLQNLSYVRSPDPY